MMALAAETIDDGAVGVLDALAYEWWKDGAPLGAVCSGLRSRGLETRVRGAPPGRSWPPRGALLQDAPSRPALPTYKKAPQRVVRGPLRKGMSFSRYGSRISMHGTRVLGGLRVVTVGDPELVASPASRA
jgi:hypothetical protein